MIHSHTKPKKLHTIYSTPDISAPTNGDVSLVSYMNNLYQFFHPTRSKKNLQNQTNTTKKPTNQTKNYQLFALISSIEIANSCNPLTGIFHINP